jgi:peptidoglycan/xylan/chitin deacetylase (PgdA/CDA1 family)
MQIRRAVPTLAGLLLCVACDSGSHSGDSPGASGQATTGGESTSGGVSANAGMTTGGSTSGAGVANNGGAMNSAGGGAANAAGAANPTRADLPVPPGASDVPKPTGAAANLKVVPWAGFTGAATYTFDDSQPSQFEHWPELKATGARVTYYISTANNYIAGYDATLKELLALGGEVGNHTVHHCNSDLTNCAGAATPEASLDAEIDDCSSYITKLGVPDTLTIAYPYGDATYAPASKTRFFLGRGVGGGLIGMGDKTDPFNLPIFAAVGGEAADVFSAQVDAAHTQKKWVIFLFHSLGPTTAQWYATVDIGAVTGSIQHAQSLPDVWVDTLANVGAYWLGATLLTGTGPTWTWTLPPHFPAGKYLRVSVDGGTLKQGDKTLAWDPHGYYEVALDAGTLSWTP